MFWSDFTSSLARTTKEARYFWIKCVFLVAQWVCTCTWLEMKRWYYILCLYDYRYVMRLFCVQVVDGCKHPLLFSTKTQHFSTKKQLFACHRRVTVRHCPSWSGVSNDARAATKFQSVWRHTRPHCFNLIGRKCNPSFRWDTVCLDPACMNGGERAASRNSLFRTAISDFRIFLRRVPVASYQRWRQGKFKLI